MKSEFPAILKPNKEITQSIEEKAVNQIVNKNLATFILIIISKHQQISSKNHHH